MHQNKSYYKNSDWQTRVHLLPDDTAWRDWNKDFREDLIITPGGIFFIRKEDDFPSPRPATTADAANFFAPAPPGFKRQGALQLPKQVPFSLVLLSLGFFRDVWRLYRQDDTAEYRLHHPQLYAAGPGFVDYDIPQTPPGTTRFGSLHSHGDHPAYHSGDDFADDVSSPGLHIILGSL